MKVLEAAKLVNARGMALPKKQAVLEKAYVHIDKMVDAAAWFDTDEARDYVQSIRNAVAICRREGQQSFRN